jgi:hypothetical protein
MDHSTGNRAGVFIPFGFAGCKTFGNTCQGRIIFSYSGRGAAANRAHALDSICDTYAFCKYHIYTSISLRSVWLGLGFSGDGKYAMASAFAQVYTDSAVSFSPDWDIPEPEKLKKMCRQDAARTAARIVAFITRSFIYKHNGNFDAVVLY